IGLGISRFLQLSPFPQRDFDFADDFDLKELRKIQNTCILCLPICMRSFSYIGYI
ncbi:hypothetical protein DENSPDRAFT_846325, partial [Dentipellis sp. KUC8613]